MPNTSSAVVLVTGCSSGIGRAICDKLAAGGTVVYGGSRSPCTSTQWTHLTLDVTDQASVDAAVAQVLSREHRLDALIACAGVGLAGSLEDTEHDEAQKLFETNYFGTVRTIRAVLPIMRKQSGGKVMVIGSIAGLIGLPYVSHYSASKFALDGLVESLRGEVAPFGIQATVVHPGDLSTGFEANRVIARNVGQASAYARFKDMLQYYAGLERNAAPPLAMARKVEKLLSRRYLPPRVIIGTPLERLGVTGKRYLPGRSFEFLLRKGYAP